MFFLTGLFPMISMSQNISVFKEKMKETSQKGYKCENISIFDSDTKSKKCISFFELICGAIAAEMPALFPSEALKAQGVAIITYFLRANGLNSLISLNNVSDSNGRSFIRHFCYKSKNQRKKMWGRNFNKYEKKIQNAVEAICSKTCQALFYKDKIAFTPFFSWCYKKTVPCSWGFLEDLPYLVSVDSPEYKYLDCEKYTIKMSKNEVKKILLSSFPSKKKLIDKIDCKKWFKIKKEHVTDYGYVKKIDVLGTVIKGSKLESILKLRSANFNIKYDEKDEKFEFTTLGNGHGVGMSQHGARVLAKKGKDYKYILNYYYPGTELVDLNESSLKK